MNIKIGRVYTHYEGYLAVRCDRKTVLGNRHVMKHAYDRDRVCDNYEEDIESLYAHNPAYKQTIDWMVSELNKGRNLVLQCHCYPLRCHTESIRKLVFKLAGK